mgnify:CR=1 FL=1
MGIKFKKVSQGEHACFYALTEDIDSVEYKQLHDWLNIHCPNEYEMSNMHLLLARHNELFFELTFPVE